MCLVMHMFAYGAYRDHVSACILGPGTSWVVVLGHFLVVGL